MTRPRNAEAAARPGQIRSGAWLSALSGLLWALMTQAAAAGDAAESPQKSLDRMTRAAQSLNYDGTFVYSNGAKMQSMRIIHRSGEEGERERLVALSGAAREVLRDRERVTCILPDSQSVVVAKSRPRQFPHSKLFDSETGFARFYTLSVRGGGRIAGRETRLVTVEPRDVFRYGYRLWLDRDTDLLLKSELVDENGDVAEQLVYTNIALPESIPDELLEPGISGDGYTWYRDEPGESSAGTEAARESAEPGWIPGWLPEGFTMSDHARDPILESRDPVEHLVYSDGLASLSVFIERLSTTGKPLDGLDSMGAVHAYGAMVDEFQITVVGEVPAATVTRVAGSITRR